MPEDRLDVLQIQPIVPLQDLVKFLHATESVDVDHQNVSQVGRQNDVLSVVAVVDFQAKDF